MDFGNFYVGKPPYQMYVEYFRPAVPEHSVPIVLFHGGSHTGSCYLSTPDGRKGWAPYLVEQGWNTYVVDWPGHGRSGFPEDFAAMSMQQVVEVGVALLERLGPAVVLTHSRSGPVGWKLAERAPQGVAAVVGVAPGPPANLLPARAGAQPDDRLTFPANDFLEYTRSSRFPREASREYHAFTVPEGSRSLNERNNVSGLGLYVSGPEALAGVPVLVVTGDQDVNHPREVDEATARYFGGDFVWLADVGLPGHGHMMMLEHGNLEVADVFLGWLQRRGR
ncbi:MAG: alpha/beta fold hydrolase [Deinococcota bacterium]|nr:alpha/beta fold hydrolase [Deinococcota bacterium]